MTGGEELNADIIVTATGLVLKLMDGMTLVVDGETTAGWTTVRWSSDNPLRRNG